MTEYFWQRLQKFAARLRGEKPRALPAEYLARLKEQASIVCEFSKRKKLVSERSVPGKWSSIHVASFTSHMTVMFHLLPAILESIGVPCFSGLEFLAQNMAPFAV